MNRLTKRFIETTPTDALPRFYEVQRKVIAAAIAKGWPGKMPDVMGTYISDAVAKEARDWLRRQDS